MRTPATLTPISPPPPPTLTHSSDAGRSLSHHRAVASIWQATGAMNGDLSLSQTLGGLRIANPDAHEASPSPPPPAPTPTAAFSSSANTQLPPSSSRTSTGASTVTEILEAAQAHPLQLSDHTPSFQPVPGAHSHLTSAPFSSPAQGFNLAQSSASTASRTPSSLDTQAPYASPAMQYGSVLDNYSPPAPVLGCTSRIWPLQSWQCIQQLNAFELILPLW